MFERCQRWAAVAIVVIGGALATARGQQPSPEEAQRAHAEAEEHYAQSRYSEALAAYRLAMGSADVALAEQARRGAVRAGLRIAAFDGALVDARPWADDPRADDEGLALYGDAAWAAGLFDEAEEAFTKTLSKNAQSVRGRFGLARALASRSRVDEALAMVQAALVTDATDADLHALQGSLLERLNRFEAAADAYDAYAARVPSNEPTPAATARTRAEFLRGFRGRTPLRIDGQDPGRSFVIPFKLVRNKVVVQGRLNGVPVDWILDTGAERVGVSYATALRARLRLLGTTITAGVGRASLRPVGLARAEEVSVGPLRIREAPVSVRNPAPGGAPRWQAESFSPIALGLSAVVDYAAKRVTLAQALPAGQSGTRLPLRVLRLPFVRGTVNASRPVYFVVDTGGELMSLSAEVASTLGMQPPRHIRLNVLGMSGPDELAYVLPGVDLDFDDIGYRRFGLAVLNLRAPSVLLGFRVGGILGHRFLGGYRVSLDLPRSELRLEHNSVRR